MQDQTIGEARTIGSSLRGVTASIGATIPSQLLFRAREQAPREVCGILLGPNCGARGLSQMDHVFAWRALSNIATDTARFRFDPAEYAREQERARALNLKILGVFHSHPGGPAHPSKDDEGQARALWGQGSSWLYLIVGLAEDSRSACRAWQLQGGFWREVRLRRLPLAPFSV